MASLLEVTLDSEHEHIRALADEAHSVVVTAEEPRIRYRVTDTFSSVLSRHLAAVEDVVLPAAHKEIPSGHELVRSYVHHAREMEDALHRLKGRLYGDGTAHADWESLWTEIIANLDAHARHEESLIHDLAARMNADETRHLVERLKAAEERAPTRPHPYSPHTGWLGRLTHRFWRIADNFWDQAEGRLIPHREPKQPARPDTLMHRYFTGAPAHRTDD